jgi:hypothetical protein
VLFAAVCLDRPDSDDLRARLRSDHLAFLSGHAPRIKIAGPFVDGEGRMTGSLLIVEARDEEEARELLAGDPYARGGLFKSVDLRAWRWTVGAPA